MCGFLACFSKNKINNNELRHLNNSAKLLEHRGRDSQSKFINDYSYFHSFRHKVLDLSKDGDQPLFDQTKKFLIVFNGIIFNHLEIRKELKQKFNQNFISNCDTETLLYGYIHFGNLIFKKLNGFWSLIIFNLEKNFSIVSRDRFGVKPLYYYVTANQIIFASEIKSLKFFISNNIQLNLNQINAYIRRGWLDHNEETLYSNIKSVKTSTFQIIQDCKITSVSHYWDFPAPSSKKLDLKLIKDKLIETFNVSTISDVPVATLLSSGIDSNAILSALNYSGILNEKKIESFTANPKNFLEDIDTIKKITSKYNIKNNIINFDEYNFSYIDKIDDLIKIQDEPIFNSSHLYQYELRKIIHNKNFHVLLTGDGADEIFAGYKKVYISYLASMFKLVSKTEFIKLLKKSKEFMNLNSFELISLLKNYFYSGLNKRNTQENKFGDEIIKQEFLLEEKIIFKNINYDNLDSDEKNFYLFYELMERFRIDIPHHLRNEDRLSSYFHICARPIFLNHSLLELVWGVHFREFMNHGSNKYILRESLKNILPKNIYNTKKKFPRPGDNSFLVYNILHKQINNMLRGEDNKTLFKKNLASKFAQDLNSNNFANAYVWLRYYFFNRWSKLNNISLSNI